MIEVPCNHCGIKMLVPPQCEGNNGVCFGCGTELKVPETSGPQIIKDISYNQGDRVTDRYVIEEQIGKGGMAVVFKAYDELVRETIALKFMKPRMLRSGKGHQAFIQEAQFARRLRHENVVAVHDVSWTDNGILYISMEFIKGQSMRGFLRKQRHERRLVDVRVAVSFIRQILQALEYAHRFVIHRDLKPENVMVMSSERVKVLDFGLAQVGQEELLKLEKQREEEAKKDPRRRQLEEEKAKSPKKFLGTLAYAAPEQKELKDLDLRADLYTVGLLFYELLTLRTPVDQYKSVEQCRNDIAPSLMKVLDKALAQEREERWSSSQEFRIALMKAYDESYRSQVTQIEVQEREDGPSTEGMVYLEGGGFLMGNDKIREEAPEDEVTVGPYWMDKYPITVEQYAKFLEEAKAPEPKYWHEPNFNGALQPVVGVTWTQAMAYAKWAGKDLPTEAQWEYAARGRDNRTFPWGDVPPDGTLANYAGNLGMTSIVGMHEDGSTPDGIEDLSGNVLEWTSDPFVPYETGRKNPAQAANAPRKACRGGHWDSKPEELRCTARKGLFPEVQDNKVGFRCVVAARAAGPRGRRKQDKEEEGISMSPENIESIGSVASEG